MRTPGLHFHHLGLAVRSADSAQRFLEWLGYKVGEAVFDPEQNVYLRMCAHETAPHVEVICPGDKGKSPVDGLVSNHTSGVVYHACYRTDDLGAALAAMEKAGLRVVCVSPPKPAVLFDGNAVSFYMVDGVGLIEILEQAA